MYKYWSYQFLYILYNVMIIKIQWLKINTLIFSNSNFWLERYDTNIISYQNSSISNRYYLSLQLFTIYFRKLSYFAKKKECVFFPTCYWLFWSLVVQNHKASIIVISGISRSINSALASQQWVWTWSITIPIISVCSSGKWTAMCT